jgi:hypothetical protein
MHELEHAEARGAPEELHAPSPPQPARPRRGDRAAEEKPAPGAAMPRRLRRGAWSGDGPIPAIERKRLAVRDLRRAYGRIKADFSEAYEQCRTDAQRRALEVAHQAAKQADLRALDERSLEDREVWRFLADGFRPEQARAERHLSRLATDGAMTRILKRLALIEALLGALSA